MARKNPESEREVRLYIVVTGRVQGVGFRYATVDAATRIGVRGWVRNTRDGTVEIVAEGSRDAVEELVNWCYRGPALAQVTSVDWSDAPSREELHDFQVRPTR